MKLFSSFYLSLFNKIKLDFEKNNDNKTGFLSKAFTIEKLYLYYEQK